MTVFDQRGQKVNFQFNAATIISWSESDKPDRQSLRKWWHVILRQEGRYKCYSIFLVLPSDKEAIRYLTDFGQEIDLISGKDCLIITLGQTTFNLSEFKAENWDEIVKGHANDGYSLKVARIFNIELDKFPCMLIFKDIRTPEYVSVPLRNMTAEEIALKMRIVFSAIHSAIESKKDPLVAVSSKETATGIRQKGQTVAEKMGNLAEKTFEIAMEAWINAAMKQP